ncbi:hypothetical protein KR200_008109, partial [Drosophila serrata]
MAQTAIDIALRKFIATTDRVSRFEAKIQPLDAPETTQPSPSTCKVRRDQIQALWEKVERDYDICSELISASGESNTIGLTLQSRYEHCFSVYERCSADLQELMEKGAFQSVPISPNSSVPESSGCRLPPVDTETFAGDCLRWPTFRDLFTAVYIHNPRVTQVEKLFHLLSKTTGEAHAIVSKAPLTNEGFVSVWRSPTDRFENRRLLQYDSVIQEYLDLSHMKEVPPFLSSPTYYLPHHTHRVIKPESTTTKLRAVFYASSPSANGTNLNDILVQARFCSEIRNDIYE